MNLIVIDTRTFLWLGSQVTAVEHIPVPISGFGSYYQECTATASRIQKLTASYFPDIILIGHNRRVGEYYANQIPLEMRARVIIISNTELSEEEITRYALLGIDRFVLRGIALIKLFNEKN